MRQKKQKDPVGAEREVRITKLRDTISKMSREGRRNSKEARELRRLERAKRREAQNIRMLANPRLVRFTHLGRA